MTKICTSQVWPVIRASNVCSTMIRCNTDEVHQYFQNRLAGRTGRLRGPRVWHPCATQCVASESLRENQKKQPHCVQSHHTRHFAILLENSLKLEMCFLLPNYGKCKAPLGSCQQWTQHIDLGGSKELKMRYSITKKSKKVVNILCAENFW